MATLADWYKLESFPIFLLCLCPLLTKTKSYLFNFLIKIFNLDKYGRSGRSIRSFLFGDQLICRFHGHGKLWVQTRSPRNLAAWVHPFRRVKQKSD